MRGKPWLKKDNQKWVQQLHWNIAKDTLFMSWRNVHVTYDYAKRCPLIEEAQWFLQKVPELPAPEDPIKVFLPYRTSRDMNYAGILSRNNDLIKDAALNGDAAAQYMMACSYDEDDDENYVMWLTRSFQGEYHEAFADMANRCLENGLEEYRGILYQGVLASSPASIVDYSQSISDIDQPTSLYLTGHLWILFNPTVGRTFTDLVAKWHEKPIHERSRTSGFVIGQFVNRLPSAQIEKMIKVRSNQQIYPALQLGHYMYLTMTKHAKEAVLAWMLISRRLPNMKDIRKIIAEMLWMSRDESVWMPEN